MSLKGYLNILFLVTLLSIVAFVMVLIYVDPDTTGTIGFFLFYTTLFFSLVGIFTIIGFRLRQIFLNNELLYSLIGLSFRQSIWLSLIIVGLLFMQGLSILSLWIGIFYVISIFLLEVYFLAE
jgi:hypothetical protein